MQEFIRSDVWAAVFLAFYSRPIQIKAGVQNYTSAPVILPAHFA